MKSFFLLILKWRHLGRSVSFAFLIVREPFIPPHFASIHILRCANLLSSMSHSNIQDLCTQCLRNLFSQSVGFGNQDAIRKIRLNWTSNPAEMDPFSLGLPMLPFDNIKCKCVVHNGQVVVGKQRFHIHHVYKLIILCGWRWFFFTSNYNY